MPGYTAHDVLTLGMLVGINLRKFHLHPLCPISTGLCSSMTFHYALLSHLASASSTSVLLCLLQGASLYLNAWNMAEN